MFINNLLLLFVQFSHIQYVIDILAASYSCLNCSFNNSSNSNYNSNRIIYSNSIQPQYQQLQHYLHSSIVESCILFSVRE